ncbi:MAG TPA: phosphodiester glycosidase family protein [Candidatus Absconditabacterales bacterium]|nr:phosphodiester glycosidase family protein [Candidatus Absconditabacterales bacterium]
MLFIFALFFFVGNVFAYKELLLENRGGKPIRVIKVVLDGQHYVVSSIALDGGDNIENLAKKVGGDTAINGTFFCPADYSSCGGITHSNFERVYLGNGKDYSKTWPNTDVRMIFGFDINGEPMMVQNNLTEMPGLRSDMNKDKINDLYFGMSNFTVLLIDGNNLVHANQNYFDGKMYSRINRNFICYTKDKSTVYMGVVGGVNLFELADYISENFQCHDALALDAGYSEAMVYDGNVLARSPRREIMDAFVVLDREEYIELTKYNPPEKEEYEVEEKYELTEKDWSAVNMFKTVIDSLIKKEGSSFKRTAIKVIREAKGMEKFIDNPQRRAIFHELLVRLYTIDTL